MLFATISWGMVMVMVMVMRMVVVVVVGPQSVISITMTEYEYTEKYYMDEHIPLLQRIVDFANNQFTHNPLSYNILTLLTGRGAILPQLTVSFLTDIEMVSKEVI